MSKFHFSCVIGDKRVNDFMAAADLRPPHKLFVTKKSFSLVVNEDLDVDFIFTKLLESLRDHYYVASLVFDGFNRNGRILTDIDLRYINEDIKVISDGKKEYFIQEQEKPHD